MKSMIAILSVVFAFAGAPNAGADMFAFRRIDQGKGLSVCFKTSYISFLLQQNVYVPELTDPLTEQLLQIGATADDPLNEAEFAGRILEISYDPVIQRARIRVTPIDRVGPVVVKGEAFRIDVPYDAGKRMFMTPLAPAKDN